eukprot:102134_1
MTTTPQKTSQYIKHRLFWTNMKPFSNEFHEGMKAGHYGAMIKHGMTSLCIGSVLIGFQVEVLKKKPLNKLPLWNRNLRVLMRKDLLKLTKSFPYIQNKMKDWIKSNKQVSSMSLNNYTRDLIISRTSNIAILYGSFNIMYGYHMLLDKTYFIEYYLSRNFWLLHLACFGYFNVHVWHNPGRLLVVRLMALWSCWLIVFTFCAAWTTHAYDYYGTISKQYQEFMLKFKTTESIDLIQQTHE